jgi:RimJ/RimL family protein N-acetyltransferase
VTDVSWLPDDWQHPVRVRVTDHHHQRPIRAADVEQDLPAVLGSQQRLWSIYGDAWGWPPPTMTRDQDVEDLQRHADEIEAHLSFNYALLDEQESELIGCVYIDPADGPDRDAEVSWWVRDEYVGTDVDRALTELVPRWITEDWPLTRPVFGPPGQEQPYPTALQ